MSTRRSWVAGAAFFGGAFLIWLLTLLLLQVGQPQTSALVAGTGELVLIGASAIYVFLTVAKWDQTDSVRLQWVLLGGASVAFFAGNLAYNVSLAQTSAPPSYPGLPDVFYVAMYVFFAAGISIAAVSYSRLVDMREPAFAAAAITVVALVVIVFGLVIPVVKHTDLSSAQMAISLFYPLADVLLLVGPAVFAVLVVRQLGTGSLAWPWAFVAFGAGALAVSDAGYAWLRTIGVYNTGSVIDMGWMTAFAAVAVGASLARDAYET
ncbi:MAG: hypothetical protein Q7W30_03245 [Coriobacteriia bacterium]|nr:hypothetical protein [Coriobacteriia bacterium]